MHFHFQSSALALEGLLAEEENLSMDEVRLIDTAWWAHLIISNPLKLRCSPSASTEIPVNLNPSPVLTNKKNPPAHFQGMCGKFGNFFLSIDTLHKKKIKI